MLSTATKIFTTNYLKISLKTTKIKKMTTPIDFLIALLVALVAALLIELGKRIWEIIKHRGPKFRQK